MQRISPEHSHGKLYPIALGLGVGAILVGAFDAGHAGQSNTASAEVPQAPLAAPTPLGDCLVRLRIRAEAIQPNGKIVTALGREYIITTATHDISELTTNPNGIGIDPKTGLSYSEFRGLSDATLGAKPARKLNVFSRDNGESADSIAACGELTTLDKVINDLKGVVTPGTGPTFVPKGFELPKTPAPATAVSLPTSIATAAARAAGTPTSGIPDNLKPALTLVAQATAEKMVTGVVASQIPTRTSTLMETATPTQTLTAAPTPDINAIVIAAVKTAVKEAIPPSPTPPAGPGLGEGIGGVLQAVVDWPARLIAPDSKQPVRGVLDGVIGLATLVTGLGLIFDRPSTRLRRVRLNTPRTRLFDTLSLPITEIRYRLALRAHPSAVAAAVAAGTPPPVAPTAPRRPWTA